MSGAEVRGSLAACGALAAVGSLVAASDVIEGYPIAAGQAARYALAAAVLLVFARGRLPRPSRREALFLAGLAATGLVLFNAFVILGVREGDPGTVGVIVACVPVVLAFAGPALERRTARPAVVGAAVVVALGAAGVEYTGSGITALGLAAALGALACEAAFSLLAVPVLARLGPLAVSAYACLFAIPLLLVWSVVGEGPWPRLPTAPEFAAFVYLGVIVTAGGFLLWYYALGSLGVERAGLFSGVLPVAALACSAAIGAAEVTSGRLAAVTVVAAGVTLGMRAGRHVGRPAAARASSPRVRLGEQGG
jgi:drug/metabolite transporter (DMT)-like permease